MPISLKNLKGLFRLAKPSQGYELVQKVRSLASGTTETAAPSPANINQRRFSAGSFIFHEANYGEIESVEGCEHVDLNLAASHLGYRLVLNTTFVNSHWNSYNLNRLFLVFFNIFFQHFLF
jgi:hypothetical protein